jgi:hypothetical protein
MDRLTARETRWNRHRDNRLIRDRAPGQSAPSPPRPDPSSRNSRSRATLLQKISEHIPVVSSGIGSRPRSMPEKHACTPNRTSLPQRLDPTGRTRSGTGPSAASAPAQKPGGRLPESSSGSRARSGPPSHGTPTFTGARNVTRREWDCGRVRSRSAPASVASWPGLAPGWPHSFNSRTCLAKAGVLRTSPPTSCGQVPDQVLNS